ncbi:hypothetical protein [Acinetobacter sp. YH01020]|uniref:hypothetical protein n=1 Tax=Acinetobacter sp. YH01020 TaxID=2601034 RepID=UPI0015D3F4EF|nr:hypothetical protein [Acinetobacter sp. YH01020]
MFEVSYLGKTFNVNSFTGTVIDTNKQLETKVSGSGGGGAVYQGSGAIAPVSISSSTTVHDNFFLIDPNGKEISVKLSNWDLSLRTGHTVQVIWVVPQKASSGPYVTVHNQNLGDVNWNDTALKTVVGSALGKHILIGLAISTVVSYLASSFGLFLLGFIATVIYFFYRRSVFAKDLKQQIQNHCL